MDTILAWLQPLNELINDPAAAQLGFAALLGLAIFTLLLALSMVVMGVSDPLRRRLRRLEASGADGTASSESGFREWLGPMGEKLVPSEEAARSRIARDMRRAGKRSPGAVNIFFGVRLLLTAVPPLLMLMVLPFLRIPLNIGALLIACLAVIGYLLPRFWLARAIKRRTRALSRGLPDALDLLVVCSEAGLGLGAAIQRVARDLEISHPELADELHLYTLQTRAGMDNKAALRDLEERTGVDDVRGLVTTLLQSMRFGTSIAMTLRLFAVELRDKRTQQAEERAAKVSTKMLFPLIFCILPSFLLVTLGPPILGVIAAFSRQGL
ncbi:type II secretion system F family protein [Halomonas sp. DQ26W]|uniref:type II secretion system F family protein n=1 Tax=Halomonas sp. DQ26W TaxID=2282311 RepID=UPI000DF75C8B|nr:type II secretion system F family protein [Halomonas sp. DQ26W]RDB43467.1 type II secretion system F family protein [Halomonas sp. DQ26W]